jgi:hypothetical protein
LDQYNLKEQKITLKNQRAKEQRIEKRGIENKVSYYVPAKLRASAV